MTTFKFLTDEQLDALLQEAIKANLANPVSHQALLSGMNPYFVGTLANVPRPIDQLKLTLDRLNTTDELTDGSVPLASWLRTAATLAGPTPAAKTFTNTLAAITSRAPAGPVIPREQLAERKERIVHENDLLPFGFLLGGQNAGRCVARALVPRFDAGQKRLLANGAPFLFNGTAWLVTPDLVLTNHHVINARISGEPEAPRLDLDRQAAETVLEFDYDHTSAPVDESRVAKLEVVDPGLDFALLRLAAPQTARKFLHLRTEPVVKHAPVNIIQHPRGLPKMVACRNNLVTYVAMTELRYFTDTEQGSSGSPVLDDAWRVVALHRASIDVNDVEYQGRKSAWVNVGTPIGAILAHLKARHAVLWDELRGVQGIPD
ncbi:trypsin-like peptidase domain-containing protein [Myxococcus sp. NMCA1]|uniref:trypsin-like peptidase domain-containing protein n=1 Tax=Myxococcus sp. NMCA1 TaxID=2996785 RepID=UPI0022857283|nr:trypsin-like peptidase domain-containing protein [Myxococcus sp. NMCA1]WAM28265.1 trypsin-like peptidase domain-containing protein [Myxococcus sp. NMCA1]